MAGAITKLQEFIFAFKGYRKEFFDESVEDFFMIFGGEIRDMRGASERLGPEVFNFFYPLILEIFFTQHYFTPNGKDWNVVTEFLEKNWKFIDSTDREYLQKLSCSYMSIYEVIDLSPGESMLLKDLVKDSEPILIQERTATQQMEKGLKLASRVIMKNDGTNLVSGRVVPLDDSFVGDLIPVLRDPKLEKDVWAEIILSNFLATMSVTPKERTFYNMEGHLLQEMKIYFPINSDPVSVENILDKLPELHRENTEPKWRWTRDTEKGGNILFAYLEIAGSKLTASVNSQERADEVKAVLEQQLAGLIGVGLASIENMDALIEKARNSKQPPSASVSSPEIEQFITEHKNNHYRKWIDIAVPMLDDISPREASQSPEGRIKLVELLKYMERNEAQGSRHTGQAAYDFTWLWQELGLLAERR